MISDLYHVIFQQLTRQNIKIMPIQYLDFRMETMLGPLIRVINNSTKNAVFELDQHMKITEGRPL